MLNAEVTLLSRQTVSFSGTYIIILGNHSGPNSTGGGGGGGGGGGAVSTAISRGSYWNGTHMLEVYFRYAISG